jgi:hypothetical protein
MRAFSVAYSVIYTPSLTSRSQYHRSYRVISLNSQTEDIYLVLYCSSGAAGIIQTVGAFIGGHLIAGIFCAIAAAGWTLQGLGNAFYFRQVRQHYKAIYSVILCLRVRYGIIAKLPAIPLTRQVLGCLLLYYSLTHAPKGQIRARYARGQGILYQRIKFSFSLTITACCLTAIMLLLS